jgi:hypothetical protein
MADQDVCGVNRCARPAHGSVPSGSPLPGDRSFVDNELRLRVCVEHGREHHRLVMGRDPRPGDVAISRVEDDDA